jgi:drug/metabolite transporter (DMT)-like permease
MIEPAIAAFLAAWLLQERLSQAEILGCLLMAVAILVLMRGEAAGQRKTSAAGKAPVIG